MLKSSSLVFYSEICGIQLKNSELYSTDRFNISLLFSPKEKQKQLARHNKFVK